jgi:hypothetical protein
MGIVLPFRPRSALARASDAGAMSAQRVAELAVLDAAGCGGDRNDVLEAATALLATCRDSYGFTVMQHGLPRDPTVLAGALTGLSGGLSLLGPLSGGRRVYPGIRVYFGHPALSWIEDGSGARIGLAAPDDLAAGELASFLRPVLVGTKRRS